MAQETTLYSVLRIPENASSDEIKQAFRRLVKLWHPDLHPDDMSAEKRMQEINEAYTVLSDPIKKKKYDDTLSQKRAVLRAKQEEQALKEARAKAAMQAARAAAAAQAAAQANANAVRNRSYADPDRAPYSAGTYNAESSYVDFTKPSSAAPSGSNAQGSPFVANDYGSDQSSVKAKPVSRSSAEEELTSGGRRMENFSIALCVLFPILIPIVYKHIKESNEMYPNSLHYQDALQSMRIITVFALPLWAFIVFIVLRGIIGTHV